MNKYIEVLNKNIGSIKKEFNDKAVINAVLEYNDFYAIVFSYENDSEKGSVRFYDKQSYEKLNISSVELFLNDEISRFTVNKKVHEY